MQRISTVEMTASTTPARVPLRATLGAYVGLIKPHVTVMLLGTTLAAMYVALGTDASRSA